MALLVSFTTTSRAGRWSPIKARPMHRRGRTQGQRRRLGRPLLWPDQAGAGAELGEDHSRQGLVPVLPLLRAEGGLFRQVVAAQRHRIGELSTIRHNVAYWAHGGAWQIKRPAGPAQRAFSRHFDAAVSRSR